MGALVPDKDLPTATEIKDGHLVVEIGMGYAVDRKILTGQQGDIYMWRVLNRPDTDGIRTPVDEFRTYREAIRDARRRAREHETKHRVRGTMAMSYARQMLAELKAVREWLITDGTDPLAVSDRLYDLIRKADPSYTGDAIVDCERQGDE